MTVIDREQFPSIGSGLWWAAQTVTTVGYGDDVPVSFAGRLLAVAVMLIGIGFLTVITAAITSTFVARSSLEAAPSGSDPAAAGTVESYREATGANRGRADPGNDGPVATPLSAHDDR
jgi:voltage-gated potassium channel